MAETTNSMTIGRFSSDETVGTALQVQRETLVVMGGFDPATLRAGATLSSTILKAQELASRGQSVEIVTEQTFLEILAH